MSRLESELSFAQSQVSPSALVSVKDQLEAKLREFGALVSELGSLQDVPPRPRDSNMEKRETDPASWRPEVPVAALSGQSHRMSGIAEEKASPGGTLSYVFDTIIHYPMGNTDILCSKGNVRVFRISDQSDRSNESPDIGPPPIAHFDCEDPIKFDPKPQPSEDSPEEANDNDDIPASLSVNLETRRKRRDTCSKSDMKTASILSSDTNENALPVRISAKRKLNMREPEEISTAPVKDDFVFSRRSSVNGDARKLPSTEILADDADDEKRNVVENAPKVSQRAERRVLGDSKSPSQLSQSHETLTIGAESVNISPRKRDVNRSAKEDMGKPEKAPKDPSKVSARERKPRISSVKAPQSSEPIVSTIEIAPPTSERAVHVPPQTPAADLFSPMASEPSATRVDGRDTPPPSGLKPGSFASADLNGASRPSRRARAAVNYAEPNLISKMRRPGKDMADALGNSRRSTSNVPESENHKTGRTVMIKQEGNKSPVWKRVASTHAPNHAEPGSPLGRKGDSLQQDSSDGMDVNLGSVQSTASGKAIAALMATKTQPHSPKAREVEIKVEEEMEEAVGRMQDVDVYDLKDSSPRDVETEQEVPKTHRRHSSINGPVSTRRRVSKALPQQTDREDKNREQLKEDSTDSTVKRPERAMARRRSMMV